MSDQESLKEIKQPLSMYDLFGYLLPGFFFYTLVVIDFDGSKVLRHLLSAKTIDGIDKCGYNYVLEFFMKFIYYDSKTGFGLVTFIIFMIFCYLTGHIMASFSSFVDRHTVRRLLKNPTENLFQVPPSQENRGKLYKKLSNVYQWLLKISDNFLTLNYKIPFHDALVEQFKKRIDEIYGYSVRRDDYYWLTYAFICARHSYLIRRISHFVNLSGFARNITGTFLFYILLRTLLFGLYFKYEMDESVTIILTVYALAAFVMFWTYLRLHKRQAVDMFYIFLSLGK